MIVVIFDEEVLTDILLSVYGRIAMGDEWLKGAEHWKIRNTLPQLSRVASCLKSIGRTRPMTLSLALHSR